MGTGMYFRSTTLEKSVQVVGIRLSEETDSQSVSVPPRTDDQEERETILPMSSCDRIIYFLLLLPTDMSIREMDLQRSSLCIFFKDSFSTPSSGHKLSERPR